VDGNSTQEHLELSPGYWRLSAATGVVRECTLPGACVGGSVFENSGDGYCAPGYIGPLCAVCDTSDNFFFDASVAACVSCAGRSIVDGATPALLLGAMFVLACSLCILKRSRLFQALEFSLQATIGAESGVVRARMLEQLEYFEHGASKSAMVDPFDLIVTYEHSVDAIETSSTTVNVTPVSKITIVTTKTFESKVSVTVKPMTSIGAAKSLIKKLRVPLRSIVGFWQISAYLPNNCGSTFPKAFGSMLRAVAIVNVDIFSSSFFSCTFDSWDFISQLFAITAAPIAISVLALSVYVSIALKKRDGATRDGQTRRHLFANAFLLLTFFVYVLSSRSLVQFFRCDSFNEAVDGKEAYLSADYSIDCNDSRYKQAMPYVLAMMLLYPIGVPCLYACLVWQQHEILASQESLELEAAYGYPTIGGILCIVEPYSSQFYWFECAECIRRLLLGAVIGAASGDSTAAPIVGLLVCLAYLYTSTNFCVYRDSEGYSLGVILSYSMMLQFLAAHLIRVDAAQLNSEALGVLLQIIFFSPLLFLVFHLVKPLAIAYPIFRRFCRQPRTVNALKSSFEMTSRRHTARGRSESSDESSLVVGSDDADGDEEDASSDESDKSDNHSEDDSLFGKSCTSSSNTSTKTSISVKSRDSLGDSDETSFPSDLLNAAIVSPDKKLAASSVYFSGSDDEDEEDEVTMMSHMKPAIGKVYGIELRSAYDSSGYDPEASSYFLDAHRSYKQDKLTSKTTCVLVNNSTGTKLKAHDESAGHWLMESLNSEDLATLSTVSYGADCFRLKLLSGHHYCPHNNYLCGVTSESVSKMRKLEAKVFSRNGESTWCFVQSLENCFEPVSSIWTLEPVFTSSNQWKIRLVTERDDDVDGYVPSLSEHYLEAHRSELSDMRSEISSSVNVHVEGASCKSEWRFHEIEQEDGSYQEHKKKKPSNMRPSFQRTKSVERGKYPAPPPFSFASGKKNTERPSRTTNLERALEDSPGPVDSPSFMAQNNSSSAGGESSLGQSSQTSTFGENSSVRTSLGGSGGNSSASSSRGRSSTGSSARGAGGGRSSSSESGNGSEERRGSGSGLTRTSTLERKLSQGPGSQERDEPARAARKGGPSRIPQGSSGSVSAGVQAGRGKKKITPTKAPPSRRRNSSKEQSVAEAL
jgi:hypothetical protein